MFYRWTVLAVKYPVVQIFMILIGKGSHKGFHRNKRMKYTNSIDNSDIPFQNFKLMSFFEAVVSCVLVQQFGLYFLWHTIQFLNTWSVIMIFFLHLISVYTTCTVRWKQSCNAFPVPLHYYLFFRFHASHFAVMVSLARHSTTNSPQVLA